MKKIIFLALCLSMSITVFGQDSLAIDSVHQKNSASYAHSGLIKRINNITKADGDSAYIKNDFATAIQIYETLLKGGEAADLYYNLGNSYYKTGDMARAILNYERALLIEPGNGDIRANLEIARSKTVDKFEPVPELFFVSWTNSLVNSMGVDSWATSGIIFFILFIIALFFYIFSRRIILRKCSFIFGLLFLLFTILANIFAFHQMNMLNSRSGAIIISPSVTIRSTPSESGTNLFVLHEGHKVYIKDNSMKEWKEIRLEDGKVGWLKSSEIEVI
ncbi:tetratricopeptide repeat protein [uncultured Bacteroides sp.]|uniref:tetratricopeptide repeat protein n=1 Tax=uncultured Bacteroides sp. TaxID=162156 RepID=UPI002AA8E9C4|nr:tetratricopeptide repeat protein [uncultured Bacteroides sp.]